MELQRLKIGSVDYVPVHITDRYTHTLVLGKSGTGKSSLLSNWWRDDGFFPVSRILIEPAGFLAQDCYSISKGKAHYCSLQHPISINPLLAPYDPNTISDIIIEALNQVVTVTTSNQALTVKMVNLLDEAIKYCLSKKLYSLVNVKDYILNKDKSEAAQGIIHRLNYLLNDERITKILCGHQSIQWGTLIDNAESFIMDCFGMSEAKMVFVGSLVAQGLKNYFRFERKKEYKPVAFYVDECHLFLNSNFFNILKEGRKFKLGCILSTQDFAVIDEKLVRVMLNVGNIISYRLGYKEASYVARENKFTTEEIQFLEKYHVAFLTDKDRGIAKTPRPPFIKPIEIKSVRLQAEPTKGWFDLEPYHVS